MDTGLVYCSVCQFTSPAFSWYSLHIPRAQLTLLAG